MNMRISHRGALGGLAAAVIATGLGFLLPLSAQAAPSLSLAAADAVIGQTVHATAGLSDSPDAAGEITFAIFGPGDDDCSGPALSPAPSPAAVSGEGQYVSGDFTPASAGTYRWSAHYSGDTENPSADSTCAAISTVDKASPSLSGNASDAVVGGAIHDGVTLIGGFSPSGNVTFSVYGPLDGSCSTALQTVAAPIQGAGATSADFIPPLAGNYRWRASYPGDANNDPASTACGAANQTSAVSKASPTLSGVATAAAIVGQTITDSATLSGGFGPTGELVFRAYGPGDATCDDPPAYEDAVTLSGSGPHAPAGFDPAPGVYRWTAEYAGDANNEATSTACGAGDQSSIVSKASPALTGDATSAILVGLPITDIATLSGSFGATGKLVFRAYGPGDATCAAPAYEKEVPISGDSSYSSGNFTPLLAGLYRWTVEYAGDANNEPASTACGVETQSSAVGTIDVTLGASAAEGTVGQPATATATIEGGATPGGQITFKAFPPGDPGCSGTPAFSSAVGVAGNGSYRSPAFLPARVGSYRWTVAYSGDVNHAPTAAGCGKALSTVGKAKPTIVGKVKQRLTVGTSFRDTATLQGGFAASGTITFRIYGPVAAGCAKPLFVNTVAVSGDGTFSSDPFVAQRPGRYSFVASYSGDVANQAVTEPCDSVGQVARVQKREPKVKPRARLIGGRLISIRAHLSGGASPSGLVNFRLYSPGNKRCKGRPTFSGGITVSSNGSYSLAKYLATEPGVYRLEVGYSGDPRNQRYKKGCSGAQAIRVG